jgi:Zinc carboxypeptidase
MSMNKIIIFLIIAASPLTLSFGEVTNPQLASYHIPIVNEEAMQEIATRFEVVRKLSDGFEVIVPVNQSEDLLKLAPKAKLIEADISAGVPKMRKLPPRKNAFRSIKNDYHSYDEIIDHLKSLAESHPQIVQLTQYGVSQDGRPLMALKLSDNANQDENEPEIMLTAATHGDEIITPEILVNLLDRLIAGYGSDQRFTKMVDEHEIYFIPVVNADGFISRERYDHGRDPNRSYPSPENQNMQPTPSIHHLVQFFSNRNFAGSIDFHAYGEIIMYPWAYTANSIPAEYAAPFDNLAAHMAESNSYTYGPIAKVIYVAKNSSADYYFWSKKTVAFAIEVGRQKAPHPREIPAYAEKQAEATWRFIESFKN